PDSGPDNPPGHAFSLAAWVRLDGPADGTVVDKADWAGGPTRGYVLRVVRGRVDFTVGGADTWHTVAGGSKLPLGRWVHVAATYDGRVGRVYVDGRPDATGALPPMVPSGYPIRIGNGTFGEARARPLAGSLAAIGIFHRTLGESEVRALAAE
ncbi:MAG TPA: LamG domain-containing protein, partial [Humisphaera sp.]